MNRIERIAKFCITSNQTCDFSIFIDESTVQANKNMRLQRYKLLPGRTRLGLKASMLKDFHCPFLQVFLGDDLRF